MGALQPTLYKPIHLIEYPISHFLILLQPSVSPLLLMRLKQRKRAFIRTEDKAALAFPRRWQKTDGGVIAEALAASLCPFFCLMFPFRVFRRKRTKQCYRRRCSTYDRTTCGCRRRARRRRLSSGSSQSGSFTPSTRNPEAQTRTLGGETPPYQNLLNKRTNGWGKMTIISIPFAFETAAKGPASGPGDVFLGSSSTHSSSWWKRQLEKPHHLQCERQLWKESLRGPRWVPGIFLQEWNVKLIYCSRHLIYLRQSTVLYS